MIKLFLNLIWYATGAGALMFAVSVVFVFMLLHFIVRLVWWLFNLPSILLGALWAK